MPAPSAEVRRRVAVSSDGGELYAATGTQIFQVLAAGASGSVGWTADVDVFDLLPGELQVNLNLVTIGANGPFFQAGTGQFANAPSSAGVGILDRATGDVRFFAGGLDETVAVMSTGPHGALLLGAAIGAVGLLAAALQRRVRA